MIRKVYTSHISWYSLFSLVFDIYIYKKFKWGQENSSVHKHDNKSRPPL